MRTVMSETLELPATHPPSGLKGVCEPTTISSTPPIVAALRDATGQELRRIPVRPEQIVGIAEEPPNEPRQPGGSGYSGIGRLDERSET